MLLAVDLDVCRSICFCQADRSLMDAQNLSVAILDWCAVVYTRLSGISAEMTLRYSAEEGTRLWRGIMHPVRLQLRNLELGRVLRYT